MLKLRLYRCWWACTRGLSGWARPCGAPGFRIQEAVPLPPRGQTPPEPLPAGWDLCQVGSAQRSELILSTERGPLLYHLVGDLGASLKAQLIKNLPAMLETLVRFLGREDPVEKG